MTITDADRELLKLLSKDINRTAYHGGIGDRAGRYLGLLDRLINEPDWEHRFPSAAELSSENVATLRAAFKEALGLLESRVVWSDMPADPMRDTIDRERIAELRKLVTP